MKRIQQMKSFDKLIWEAQDLKFDIIESEGKSKVLKLSGTAMVEGKSRNGVNYRCKNFEENNGEMFNFLVGHRDDYDNPDHNVGEGTYIAESSKLRFEGNVSNNKHHPDIIEQIQLGRVSVSVQGKVKSVIKEGDTTVVEGLRIPLLCFVNKHTRGIEGATIESAIAERMEIDNNKTLIAMEAEKMSEELTKEIVEKQLLEKDEKIKGAEAKQSEAEKSLKEAEDKLAMIKKKEEEAKSLKKKKLVESLVGINKELKSDELDKKSLSELELMEGYEKKIQETEGNNDGDAEVEDDGKGTKESDDLKGIIVDKNSGDVTMSESMRLKFNKDIEKSIYR